MTDREKVFVYGASGHAKVVIDALQSRNDYEVAFVIDDDESLRGRHLLGCEIVGGRMHLVTAAHNEGVRRGIVAIGSNSVRRKVVTWLADQGLGFISAIHRSAAVASEVTLGEGTAIMAGVVINSGTAIGRHAIVNTAASVDHDCRVADFVHIAPGSHLCGGVDVGENTFICAGVTIVPNRKVGRDSVVGAGATVLHDLTDGITAVGTPARVVSRKA